MIIPEHHPDPFHFTHENQQTATFSGVSVPLMRLCYLIPRCVLALASLFCITATKGASTPIEQVLHRGDVIYIHNENGDLRIEAIDDTKRFLRWKDGNAKIRLMPRKIRWYGSLGLYSVGDNWFGKRLLVEEGWQNFQNKQELMDWLNTPWQVQNMKYVWTNTGLVAGWCEIPSRKIIAVDLWQVYIDGQKPTELSGARDNAIIKTSPTTLETSLTTPGDGLSHSPLKTTSTTSMNQKTDNRTHKTDSEP